MPRRGLRVEMAVNPCAFPGIANAPRTHHRQH
jgi:hypothetical protein